MPEIILPKLSITYFKRLGTKNVVEQLLLPSAKVGFTFVRSSRSYSVVESNGIEICITPNRNLDLANFEFIVLSNKRATKPNLESNDVILKKWIKHPENRSYTNIDIVNSWTNKFNFIEENLDEYLNPLIGWTKINTLVLYSKLAVE